MKKLLRLLVACSINHDDKYYKDGLKSVGIDYWNLSHNQISAWKASVKVIEADVLIQYAFSAEKIKLDEIDLDFINVKHINK